LGSFSQSRAFFLPSFKENAFLRSEYAHDPFWEGSVKYRALHPPLSRTAELASFFPFFRDRSSAFGKLFFSRRVFLFAPSFLSSWEEENHAWRFPPPFKSEKAPFFFFFLFRTPLSFFSCPA